MTLWWNLYRRLSNLENDMATLAEALANLMAARAKDVETDNAVLALLSATKAKIDDLSGQLAAALAKETIDPAAIQNIADQMNAHSAEMAAALPAPAAPVEPAPVEPAPTAVADPAADPSAPGTA